MAQVRLEHVNKTYKGNVEAVKDLNLVIEDGEFLALLGPSGCGKTSTLRMIVGLEDITGGEIIIRDRVVNKLEPNERNVALAFETYALYPPLTVYDNIAFCQARNDFLIIVICNTDSDFFLTRYTIFNCEYDT